MVIDFQKIIYRQVVKTGQFDLLTNTDFW